MSTAWQTHWWDPTLPIYITNHVQHFCDNLGQFALKDDKRQQRTTTMWHFATICNVLCHSTILYSAPFHFFNLFCCFWTICDIFRFHIFNTPPDCIAFSSVFHQTLFTWLLHHSFSFLGIISGWSALRFTDVLRFILLLQLYLCFCYHHYQIQQSSPFTIL